MLFNTVTPSSELNQSSDISYIFNNIHEINIEAAPAPVT
jgi:hypothetical protein